MCLKNNLFQFFFILAFLTVFTRCQQQETSDGLAGSYIPSNKKNDSSYSTVLGFVIGPVMFILSFVGVWFNQKRAAVNYTRLKLADSLLEGEPEPIEYNLDNWNRRLHPESKLVHRTGLPQMFASARDEECQVFPPNALSIKRKVQVRQVRAYTKRRSNQQEIQYRLQWVSENIQECERENNSPLRWFIKTQQFTAPEARLCGYLLIQSQLIQLECDDVISPQPETIAATSNIAYQIGAQSQPIVFEDYIYFPAENGDIESRGSLRVKFYQCKNTELSIICAIDDSHQTYEPFRIDLISNNGRQDTLPCEDSQCCICCHKLSELLKPICQINLIFKGKYNSHEIISMSIKKNLMETNILRLVFFCLMVIGICIFFSPITQLLGYLPLVGGFLKSTSILIVFIAAFLVSIPLFAFTFGFAWLRYHPKIGSLVIAAAFATMVTFSLIEK